MRLDLCPHECVLCSARDRKAEAQARRDENRNLRRSFTPAPAQIVGERVCGCSANRAGRDSAKPNCSDSLRLGRSGWQGQLLGVSWWVS